MERSFSHLLRTSRLATFDKTIPQIYTTSGKAKAIGDWGLKRNLPTVLRTHYLTIEQLDTAEHQTPFKSGSSDYLFLQRWKENFPRSRPPQPQPIAVRKDLSTLTDAEFKKLLETAREKRQAWKEAVAKNEYRTDEHLSFLNIVSRQPKSSSIDTSTSQASVGTGNSSTTVNNTSPAPFIGSNVRTKVGPTYGFYEPSTPVVVQGRGIGRTKNSQLIGVCGVVATFPIYSTPHLQNATKSLQPYYVYKAELDADGHPNVVLGHVAPGPGNWLTGSIGSRSDHYNYNAASRLPQGANSNTGAAAKGAEGDTGRRVVSRVQHLLETRDKSATRL
ncbi:hypothetical protein BX616_003512 [Lobosporangium transversale]|uniref:Mitochondrial ribosomal protein MRP51 n=1 Tax=Lobosporangium transversale TaxID=64571 RepID=A0A1Y2GVG1_9FUNG|nr:hypothetical protein BCR41DRAFT_349093 [Lobosporangium transversale]KAF9916540.1 hypothetical protein BX616_003512 [Lobosporangium transversale]ORZ23755.1 hypothetical protein BCR41DRAFT_349093 [Lobosporangium transversale]|eukprot:XP_021883569.1 hypothetical protein BCR41DRAFT_349093 [Lobosporangium transversale]